MKDKAYYEDVNIKNELKLRDMIKNLHLKQFNFVQSLEVL